MVWGDSSLSDESLWWSPPPVHRRSSTVFAKLTALVLLLLFPAGAKAGLARTTMQVTAQVINNCVVNIPTSVILPAYTGTQVRSRAELQLNCTRDASPIVSLGNGALTAGARARVLMGPNGS